MMQHTQTHRNGYSIVTASQSKEQAGQRSTRQASQQPIKKAAEQPTKKNSSNLYIQTGLSSPTTTTTLASLSPTTTKRQHKRQYSSSSSSEEEEEEEEEDHDPITPTSSFSRTKRRLSVADLCNPVNEKQPQIYLTKDEFEALEGFGRLNYSTEDLFNYSLRDLASNAHILH
jgi:(p)ppGpp synthase/HD superfamily hydrolase